MFERETHREKILEARHREMKLKERMKGEMEKVQNALWYYILFVLRMCAAHTTSIHKSQLM